MSTEPKAADTARTGPGALGRPPLSRKRIIETAIDFVDRRGLIALTMRRLGEELGVEAMSLYRYVNGRQDLLEGIVDQMVAHLHLLPGQAPLQPTDGWQVYLRWLAHGVRELSRTHPNAFPLLATRHPAAPWLRPPLRSLRVVEEFLAMLSSKGFSDVRVVVAYRAFSSFLLGHLLHEVSLLSVQTSPAEKPPEEAEAKEPHANRSLDLNRFHHVKRLEVELSEDRAAPEFEQALEDLLNRLNRLMTGQ
jgi:TetR/AcrR family transcriptional regulator, tetracycline repressor protein